MLTIDHSVLGTLNMGFWSVSKKSSWTITILLLPSGKRNKQKTHKESIVGICFKISQTVICALHYSFCRATKPNVSYCNNNGKLSYEASLYLVQIVWTSYWVYQEATLVKELTLCWHTKVQTFLLEDTIKSFDVFFKWGRFCVCWMFNVLFRREITE